MPASTFKGFERVVDSIGGINIDVEKPIRDDEYPDGNYGIMRIFIPAGLQHMNGQVALQYARSRHSDNDFGRIRRQQKLLLALREQGLQLGLIPKLPWLFTTLRDAVATDIPAREALTLAQLAAQVDVKSIAEPHHRRDHGDRVHHPGRRRRWRAQARGDQQADPGDVLRAPNAPPPPPCRLRRRASAGDRGQAEAQGRSRQDRGAERHRDRRAGRQGQVVPWTCAAIRSLASATPR